MGGTDSNITIPEEAAIKDPITTEVIDDVKEAIKTVTGLDFQITVVKEEEE